MIPKTMHTMARAYQDICAGEDPWTALGNFANAWYDYARDARTALVSEPLGEPGRDTEHTRHWAAFCAASIEFLCDRYGVPCPVWVHEPHYTLSTAWYGDIIVNFADNVVLEHRPRDIWHYARQKETALHGAWLTALRGESRGSRCRSATPIAKA